MTQWNEQSIARAMEAAWDQANKMAEHPKLAFIPGVGEMPIEEAFAYLRSPPEVRKQIRDARKAAADG